ncbi:sodium/hydrogen exchanger 6, partial [Tanacetum coccineum]
MAIGEPFGAPVTVNSLDVANPLHVQNSDNSSSIIIPFKVLGTENYRIWSGDVKLAFQARNKYGFVDGTCLKESYVTSDVLSAQGDRCNAMPVRSSLLTRDPLLEVKDAYNVVSRKESHRGVPESFGVTESKQNATSFGPNPNLHCKHCGKIGIDRCFEIVGFPQGFKRNSNTGKQTFNANANANLKMNDKPFSSLSSGFTPEQMQKLLIMINDKPSGSIHSNMACRASFFNAQWYSCYYQSCCELKLTNNVILYDLHVVLWYCVIILSVNKLIRDSKMFVGFNENKCYIQDLKREKVMGTGSESGGLYLFDMKNSNCIGKSNVVMCFHVSKLLRHNRLGHPADQVLYVLKNDLSISDNSSVPMCEVCKRAKQTREPFPLSDHKSKTLGKLVHLDLWGPYRVHSREGYRYFLAIVDDYSRAVWFPQSPYDDGKDSSVEDGSLPHSNNSDSTQGRYQSDRLTTTQVDDQNWFEGNLQNSVPSTSQSSLTQINDEVQTPVLRRSDWQSKPHVRLNDYGLNSNVKYGIEKYVNYSKLNSVNLCFATSLNKSIEPSCLSEAMSVGFADFMESITICIPDLDEPGHTKETIRVEYEWKPPRCPTYNIFRHTGETCPKKVVTNPIVNDTNVTNDGFQKVVNRKLNNKGSSAGNKLPKGVLVSKGFQVGKEFAYQPKASNVGFNGNTGTRSETSSKAGPSKNTKDDDPLITKDTNTKQQDTGKKKISNIASPNPFTALGVDDDEDEKVEKIWDESKNQKEVREVVNENNLSVCTILESHVDVAAVYDTCKKVCSRWKLTSNRSLCSKGSRIILGWNDDLVDVMIMAQTNQVMHVQVNTRADHKTFFCSFVYADDYDIDRRMLWTNLVGHAVLMRNRPWVLLGDFNPMLNLEDHSAGGYEPNASIREFKECVQTMEVADVNSTGLHFTWNQKPKSSNGILKKIDRIMDHSLCVLHIPTGLKSPFRKLLHNHSNLHERVNKIRIELDEAQKEIDRDPSSSILREEHAHYLLDFKEAQLDEERFLKQKAKIEWLKADDFNTAYFHKIVKSKCARNKIQMVSDASNNLYDGNQVLGALLIIIISSLGAEGVTIPLDDHDLFTRVLDDAKADFMVRDVSNDEVKSVIFS